MKIILFVVAVLMVIEGSALADETKKTKTVHVKPPKEGGKFDFPAPGPGEHLVVIVDRPAKKAAPVINKKYVTVVQKKGGDLDLRFGLNIGGMFPGHPSVAVGGGLNFEIGHVESMWRLQAALGAGNCAGSSHNGDGVAVNSGLALMARMGEHLRIGPGVDLLYCSDIASHPREKANERLVGTSFRAELKEGYASFNLSVGLGVDTVPMPGDRKTTLVPYAMANIVLWTSK